MAVYINDDSMSGDHTGHTARAVPGRLNVWEVSWLPGRLMDRGTAITAMVLADAAGSGALETEGDLWLHAEGWAAELGLTAPDAVARASQPPGRTDAEEDGAMPSDPEAAG